MSNFSCKLKEEAEKHQLLIDKLKSAILKYPQQNILFKQERGKLRFYSDKKYLGERDINKIKTLIQRKYDLSFLNALEIEKKAIDECLRRIAGKKNESVVDEILDKFPESVRPLISLSQETNTDFARQWENAKFMRRFSDNKYSFFTKKNERVRSKTEVIIADRLYEAGVPYHYEKLLLLDSFIPFYPDFTVLNVRLEKEYIWEHFGMMGNADYNRNALSKINTYHSNGYVQGKNLIMTFEGEDNPINTKIIDSLIDEFLL